MLGILCKCSETKYRLGEYSRDGNCKGEVYEMDVRNKSMYLWWQARYLANFYCHTILRHGSRKIIDKYVMLKIWIELNLYYSNIVDGSWTRWGAYGSCDVTCGYGTKYRSRTCTNPSPANGGKECLGSSKEQIRCNTGKLCPSK